MLLLIFNKFGRSSCIALTLDWYNMWVDTAPIVSFVLIIKWTVGVLTDTGKKLLDLQ